MKRISIVLILLLHLLLLGCSVKYTANPLTNLNMNSNEICVIKDKDTREEFLPAYRAALENKGFIVRVLNPGSDINTCPLTSTYTGSWSWDFKMYMASLRSLFIKMA